MTKFLHISDTHISSHNRPVAGRLDTEALLKQLINRLLSAREQWGQIDALLATGDISDDGSADSYERFKSLVAPLELPVYVIPGNHDAREPMRNAFLNYGYLPDTGPLNWHQRIGGVNVIGLDTLVEGVGYGRLLPETLTFLESQLSAAKHEPVLVMLHHPPFNTGIVFMDAIGLKNINEFEAIIANATSEVRIACGHIHSMIVANVKGQTAVSSPAPCSNFEFDLREDAMVGFYDREDGCLLHRWENGFQTVRIGPLSGSGPYPFKIKPPDAETEVPPLYTNR